MVVRLTVETAPRRRRRGFGWRTAWPVLLAALSLATAAQAQTSPATVSLTALWDGVPPSHIELNDVRQKPPFTIGKDRAELTYTLSGPTQYLQSARVTATYADGNQGLALRLSPGIGDVTLKFYRPNPQSCTEAGLKIAELKSTMLTATEESFFMARALATLSHDCSVAMKKRAVRAWFDRAFQLVTVAPYFDLDPEAADAETKIDKRHVEAFKVQAGAVLARRLFDQQTTATSRGDYALAAGLNEALRSNFGKNAAVMKVAKLKITNLKIQAVRTARALKKATAPPPTPPVQVDPPVPPEVEP